MAYKVYTTPTFDKEVSKLSRADQDIIDKLFQQLKDNPYVGDQIRFKFFREKRIKEKRMYYLVYDDFCLVLAVAFGGKKDQQKTIEEIIKYLPEYKEYAKKLKSNN